MAFGWSQNPFSYGVTRNFDAPRFTSTLLICEIVWIGVVIILSVGTVGYEYRSMRTIDFNGISEQAKQLFTTIIRDFSGYFISRRCRGYM